MRDTPVPPGGWIAAAECAQHPSVSFDMPGGRPELAERARSTAAAKAICRACPVVAECAAWSLTVPDPVPTQIAGGMTPGERHRRRWEASA
jgi:WhiB family redox-sensing transcriptional regulator